MSGPLTLLDALCQALERAGHYNSNDQVAPAAILWTDSERQWEPLLAALRSRLPILTLGAYDPARRTGPSYWIRCMLAGTLPGDTLPAGAVPILYLPGVSRQTLRAIEECPKAVQPLAELQYRGLLWTQKNGRDWTVAAFLQSREGGLGIPVAGDGATREALVRALPVLAREPLDQVRKAAPLAAPYLDELLNPDEVRRILLWMDDPAGYHAGVDPAAWVAFCNLCQRAYGFHPEADGPVTAAQKLGANQGPWQLVWQRFCEAPAAYPHLPALLRQARPPLQLALFEQPAPYWPQDNEAAEADLRQQLQALHNALPADARAALQALEEAHGERRSWVWAKRGEAPLATAVAHLVALAHLAEPGLRGATVAQIAAAYTGDGWRVDEAALAALAAVKRPEDQHAVAAALRPLYQPWLERAAIALQQAMATQASDPAPALPTLAPGTCLLFTDALRFDLGQRLIAALEGAGLHCESEWRLAALPTVTPTAKPAVTPVAGHFTGAGADGLAPVVAASGATVNAQVLRNTLRAAGYQILTNHALGDPTGLGWNEVGAIDSEGHQDGWRLAHRIEEELRLIHERVRALLDHGWRQVVVITDHGWLLLPGNLPKAELPIHSTQLRKGRCARLKPGVASGQPAVAWHWDPEVLIAVAPGIHCFEEGKLYEHGGISPQECIVPLITVSSGAPAAPPVTIERVTWRRQRCTVQLSGSTAELLVDIRTQAGNPASSLLAAAKAPEPDGSVSLLVEDEDRAGAAAIVVVVGSGGLVRAQMATIVGE